MLHTLVYAVPLALMWVTLSNQATPSALFVGYVFGVAVLWVLRANTSIEDEGSPLRLTRLPVMLWAMLRYGVFMAWEILLSGLDVARRILRETPDIAPAIHRVPVGLDNPLVAALSAHAITITPGSLVIDFEDDERTMIVHVLDTRAVTAERLAREQAQRLEKICQMIGQTPQEAAHD